MANATAGGAYSVSFDDINLSNLYYGTRSVYTSTQFSVTYSGGIADNFYGTGFTYDSSGLPSGGTITSFSEAGPGGTIYSVTNVSVSVTQFVAWASSGATATALASIFSGADTVVGSPYADLLRGYAGDDRLDGGGGPDTLIGGAGNDTYLVDSTGDYVVESAGGGTDVVLSSLSSYSLPSEVENFVFQGSGTLSLFGNYSANLIDATQSSSSTLVGAGGADTLMGGQGPDLFRYSSSSDSTTSAPDHIVNFQTGLDKIDLSGAAGGTVTLNLGASGNTSVLFGSSGDIEVDKPVAGADLIVATGVKFVFNGSAAADSLVGGPGADTINGGDGSDTLRGAGGSDVLAGGNGSDTAALSGFAHDYTLVLNGGAGTVAGGPEGGTDRLTSIENVQFLDGTLTFDTGSTAAQILRLYDSFLGRAPDAAGFESYLRFVAAGHNFQDMATNAASSPEFANATAALTDSQYVTYVYEHSLHREPDPGGLATYVADLQNGTFTRTSMIVQAAESPEHVALTAGVVAAGLWIPDEKVESLELLYDAAVQRQPDATGIAGYSAEVASGTTYRQIANQMASSAEFQAAHAGQSDAQYIDSLYVAEVGRHADPTGLAAYSDQLAHGYSRGDVLYETAFSQEHQSHVLAYYDPLLG